MRRSDAAILQSVQSSCRISILESVWSGARRPPMDQLLRLALRSIVKRGALRMTTVRGTVITAGDGTGAPVAVRTTSARAERALLLNPELGLGEAYMAGAFVVEQGSIADFLGLILSQ